MMKLGKKGNASNWFAVLIVLFTSGFLMILAYTIILNMCGAFDDIGFLEGKSNEFCTNILAGIATMDTLMVLMLVVLIAGVGITSYNLATKPVFAIISFILAPIYGYVAYYFSFTFQSMITPTPFAPVLVFFPRTILICSNLHWVMVALILIGLVTLFGKKEKGQFIE